MCHLRAAAPSRRAYRAGRLALIASLAGYAGCGIVDPTSLQTEPPDISPLTVSDDQPITDDPVQPTSVNDEPITLSFNARPVFCCDRFSFEFTASISDTAPSEVPTFEWNFGDGRSATGANVEHTYYQAGSYVIVLTARTAGGTPYAIERYVSVGPSGILFADDGAPLVNDITVTLSANRIITVRVTGSDPDGDDLHFTIIDMPQHGSMTALPPDDPASALWLYTPDTDFYGTDYATFQAFDGSAVSNMGTVTLHVIATDANPTANDHAYLVPMGTTVRLTLTGQADNNVNLTFAVSAPPTHGTLGIIDNAAATTAIVPYTPDPGFQGTDAFEFRVNADGADSTPARVSLLITKLFVPWIELNAPTELVTNLITADQGAEPGMTMLDYCLKGIDYWAQITDTVFVSTMPGQSRHLYAELMKRKPAHVRIVGGLKTVRLPGTLPGDTRPYDFADPVEWASIDAEAQKIVAYTGTNIVLLENETALTPYTFGEASIDYERLRSSLSSLHKSGVEYWWNLPRILPDLPEFPDRLADSTAFVKTIAEALPDSVFLGGYTAWYDWRYQLEWRSRMLAILGERRMHERLLVTPDGYYHWPDLDKRCFTPAEAIERAGQLVGDAANIYPSAEYWITVGKSFATQLPPLAQVIR